MYTMKYLVRRLSMYLLTVATAVIINFVVPRLIPGNPIQARLQELYRMGIRLGGQEFIEKYSRLFSLDQPVHVQFVNYVASLLQGNLGFSISYFPATVADIIRRCIPWSIGLLGVAILISFVLGTLLGSFLGWSKREGKGSKLAGFGFAVSIFLNNVPFYALGMILIYTLAYMWAVFPYGGGYSLLIRPGTLEYVIDIIMHAFLPALAIISGSIGAWAIEARGLMIGVLGEDYLALARAKGLPGKYVFRQYAMKNTFLPLFTDLALSLSTVVSGSIIVEIIFSYPGIGNVLFTAIQSLDYPVIQGTTLIIILGVTTAALIVDLIYPMLDPRIGEK